MNRTYCWATRSWVASSFLLATVLLSGCGGDYTPRISSDDYKNETIREVLENVERAQADSRWFRRSGHNPYSRWLNICLVGSAIVGGFITAVEGSKLWKKTDKPRLAMVLFLSLFATISSSMNLYLKAESERFLKDNRHQYTKLSIEIDGLIRDFYFQFRRAGFDDDNIDQRRDDLLDLAKNTLDAIHDLRLRYNGDYGLETNPDTQ